MTQVGRDEDWLCGAGVKPLLAAWFKCWLFPIQLPEYAPGKAAEDNLSAWVPEPTWGWKGWSETCQHAC